MVNRRVFMSIAAQEDNLGDIEIRRNVVNWVLGTQRPLTLFLGSMPDAYVDAYDLPNRVRRVRSGVRFEAELLWSILRRKANLVFSPGPEIFGASFRGTMKSVLNLANVGLVGLGGGRAVAIGRALRGSGRVPLAIERLLIRRFASYTVRDTVSASEVGIPLVVEPDIGFATLDPVLFRERTNRSTIAFSFRNDRRVNASMLASIVAQGRSFGLEPVFVTQVRRDSAIHDELALNFRAGHVSWIAESHLEQEEDVLAAYAGAAIVVSNRLHALIFGMLRGAVPIAVIDEGSDKLTSTLAHTFSLISVSGAGETPRGLVKGALDSSYRAQLHRQLDDAVKTIAIRRDQTVSSLMS